MSICANIRCGNTKNLKSCPCRKVQFCSTECQKASLATHKFECLALKTGIAKYFAVFQPSDAVADEKDTKANISKIQELMQKVVCQLPQFKKSPVSGFPKSLKSRSSLIYKPLIFHLLSPPTPQGGEKTSGGLGVEKEKLKEILELLKEAGKTLLKIPLIQAKSDTSSTGKLGTSAVNWEFTERFELQRQVLLLRVCVLASFQEGEAVAYLECQKGCEIFSRSPEFWVLKAKLSERLPYEQKSCILFYNTALALSARLGSRLQENGKFPEEVAFVNQLIKSIESRTKAWKEKMEVFFAKTDEEKKKALQEAKEQSLSAVPWPLPASELLPDEWYKQKARQQLAEKPLEMKITEEFGQGLYSKARFEPQDIIFSEKPSVSASILLTADYCSICFRSSSSSTLSPCSGCKNRVYCSGKCRRFDILYRGHALICGLTYKSHQQFLADTIKRPDEASSSRKNWVLMYEISAAMLVNPSLHLEDFTGSRTSFAKWKGLFFQPFADQWERFYVNYFPFAWNPIFDGEWWLRACLENVSKSISVATESPSETKLHPLICGSGIALLNAARLCNHSCRPNAKLIFAHGQHHCIATRKILQGEQIFINYVEPSLNFQERQQSLQLVYGFQCRCDLCQEESHDTKENQTRSSEWGTLLKKASSSVMAREEEYVLKK